MLTEHLLCARLYFKCFVPTGSLALRDYPRIWLYFDPHLEMRKWPSRMGKEPTGVTQHRKGHAALET